MPFLKYSIAWRLLWLFPLSLLLNCSETRKEEIPWESLFNGENLQGWHALGGKADYEARDKSIIGSTVHDTPNTFLVSDRVFSDFILELEVKVDPSMNSGIQVRSNSLDAYQNGRVHGYQVEVDPSERAWSGGIYDEGRRGWLFDLSENPKAQSAFLQNEWNHYRIEAIGDTLKTWINGVEAAHLIDSKTDSGFIGLQVHSIGPDATAGTEVAWRNLRVLTTELEKHARPMTLAPVVTKNNLTPDETKKGWMMLWDGSGTSGWRGAKLEGFPEEGWEIEDGILTVLASGGAESRAGGDIVTTSLYGDFELKVDFMITRGANSGIKYYVDTELNRGEGSAIGLEYQILDDAVHPDATKGRTPGIRTMASLYDLIAPDENKLVNPPGEWNTAHIISVDNHVEHWLNGVKVVEYQRGSDDFRKLVSESKYAIWPNFGELKEGRILLQDHGDRVSFKNIKIRPMDKQNNH